MKVELSSDTTNEWNIEEITEVLRRSLTQLHEEDDTTEIDRITHESRVEFLCALLNQYPPKLIVTDTTSYLFKNSKKYYFYMGMVTEANQPQKYDVYLCYYPNPSIRGKMSIHHTVTTPEGELRVLGLINFLQKPNDLKKKIRKITTPNHVTAINGIPSNHGSHLTLMKRNNDTSPTKKVDRSVSRRDTEISGKSLIIKKKKQKKSGLNSMLKYFAPGTAGLFKQHTDSSGDERMDEEESQGKDYTEEL